MEQPTQEDVLHRLSPIVSAIDLAWRTHSAMNPDQDDLIVIVHQRTAGDGIASTIGILTRAEFLNTPQPPPLVAQWFAGPAGEAEPRVPNARAIWIFVIEGDRIIGMSRMLRESGINSPGGLA